MSKRPHPHPGTAMTTPTTAEQIENILREFSDMAIGSVEHAMASAILAARDTVARLDGELQQCLQNYDDLDEGWCRSFDELRTRAGQLEEDRDRARRILDATAEAVGFARTYDPSPLPAFVAHTRTRADAAARRVEAVTGEKALAAAAKAAFAERTGADPSTATPDEIDQYIEIADATIRAALAAASDNTATTEG